MRKTCKNGSSLAFANKARSLAKAKLLSTCSGFTLIELMVAIAIAALLVAMAIPNFSVSIKNSRLTAKANDLMVGLKMARQTAISRSVPTFVCHSNNADTNTPICGGPGSDWNTGFILYSAPTKTLTTAKRFYAPAADTLIQQIDIADGQKIIITATNATNIVSFGSDGYLFDSAAVEMQICDDRSGENGYLIRVSLSGKISRETATGAKACT
jgi:type IV fimbrial biogenesis protein FimT